MKVLLYIYIYYLACRECKLLRLKLNSALQLSPSSAAPCKKHTIAKNILSSFFLNNTVAVLLVAAAA